MSFQTKYVYPQLDSPPDQDSTLLFKGPVHICTECKSLIVIHRTHLLPPRAVVGADVVEFDCAGCGATNYVKSIKK